MEGYNGLIATHDGNVPDVNRPAALLQCFAAHSERIRQLLDNIALLHVALGHKMKVFNRNPTEQEIVNCLLNVAGLALLAHLAQYDATYKRKIVDAFTKLSSTFEVDNRTNDGRVNILVNSIN